MITKIFRCLEATILNKKFCVSGFALKKGLKGLNIISKIDLIVFVIILIDINSKT